MSQPTAAAAARPGLAKAHLGLAYALPVLVLVQAALAGQHLFEGSSISVHGVIGELVFALTVVGLGLAIVRQIARIHGGEVSCAPREGGGSRFAVTLSTATP